MDQVDYYRCEVLLFQFLSGQIVYAEVAPVDFDVLGVMQLSQRCLGAIHG